MRKDVYLYEYMDSLERFNETSLLPKSAFYSKLKGDITDADYEHAQKVWRVFDMKTLGDWRKRRETPGSTQCFHSFKFCLK